MTVSGSQLSKDFSAGSQPVETTATIPGNPRPKKLKAKHLSALTKKIIVERFAVLQSYDDVAREMEIPGLTGRTVSECLHLLTIRKPPEQDYFMGAARRHA